MTRLFLFSALILKVVITTEAQKPSYWQQHVDYDISVALNDSMHMLNGNISMIYTNNSPESLTEIWMHIWPNAYENAHTALGQQFIDDRNREMLLASAEELGFIDELNFQVGGKSVTWEYHPEHRDIARLMLPEPLQSGASVTIATPFRVKIPSSDFSRLGHSGNSYQITQWYPKPAVFDQSGWHAIPYLNQGEFYSEFGNYHVTITVPSNYIVAASGNLLTESERNFLLQKAAETAAMENFSSDNSFPPSAATTKTLEYELKDAHDFAWFADKRFHVLHGQAQLPYSGRTVDSWSYFTNFQTGLWMKSIDYLNRSVIAYSNYAGEYQWDVVQAVEGALSAGAGMEYPTITIIGGSANAAGLDNVITHEVGHNWFYGMLGSNERDHAWMDEGINSYYENRYMTTYYPNANPLEPFLGNAARFINADALEGKNTLDMAWYLILGLERMNKSQAIDQHSNNFTQLNYGLLVYMKTAYLMRYMADFLGQGQFDRVMGKYFEEWNNKHPQPEDIRRVFEEETGENMAWFFEGLLKDDRSLDYKITEILDGQTTMAVRVHNNTDIAGPFPVSVMRGDSILRTEWHRGFTGTQTIYVKKLSSSEEITKVRIDAHNTIPDNNRENNTMRVSGLFKKVEPLALKPFFSPDNPDRTTISYLPLVGFNVNDGWMVGLGLWNSTFPAPKLEWVAAPLYSFRAQGISGQGSLGWNIYPERGAFSRVRLSVSGASYHVDSLAESYYSRLQPAIDIDLRKKQLKDPVKQSIRYRNVRIGETYVLGILENGEQYKLDTAFWFNELSYTVKNRHLQHPYQATLTAQQGPDLIKLFADVTTGIHIRKYEIEARLFAGWMSYFKEDPYSRYAYSLTGVSSYNDYLYDDILPGRNATDGMWSNQITRRDGFLKLPADTIALGLQDDVLLALNLEFPVPKLPLAFFADAAYVPGDLPDSISGFQYDAGVMIRLLNNVIEVYFPLLASDGLVDPFNADYGTYMSHVSFLVNFNGINPFELMRKLEF
ncbi:MAG TPA: hypothetical protein DCG24_03535 [Bacteroidetes bacterium]|nr:hypothetical protein [Bacteroidota bacterium]HQU38495.1 M1 family metallopeptidase [Chitinophagales bacterium]